MYSSFFRQAPQNWNYFSHLLELILSFAILRLRWIRVVPVRSHTSRQRVERSQLCHYLCLRSSAGRRGKVLRTQGADAHLQRPTPTSC